MPKITLNLSAELLEQLVAGDVVELQATLTQRKKRTAAEKLSDQDAETRRIVTDLYHKQQSAVAPARVWKALAPALNEWENRALEEIVAIALDWNEGRVYPPEWLAKELDAWWERVAFEREDMLGAEMQRSEYRRRFAAS